VLAALALSTAGAAVAAPPAIGAADTTATAVSQTFNATASEQTWTVPANVCSVTVTTYGAQGGAGTGDEHGDIEQAPGPAAASDLPTAAGALGGKAVTKLTVTPGEVLSIFVGGRGGDASASTTADVDSGATAVATGGAGGFNGGAPGGQASATTSSDNSFGTAAGGAASAGGGGGGASDVRRGGNALANRVIVAGGGGGGAGASATIELFIDQLGPNIDNGLNLGGDGGAGGGASGSAGADGTGSTGTGGGGGTQTTGGAAGQGADPTLPAPGTLGNGGAGGFASDHGGDLPDLTFAYASAGGGGGGGLYGGGGGAVPAAVAKAVPPDFFFGTPGGAGGGSGFAPSGTLDTGVHSGDGQVIVEYDPVADACAAAPPVAVQPNFTG